MQALDSSVIDRLAQIEVLGELGVCYRHMDDFTEAGETLEKQYTMARRLSLEAEAQAYRAAGNPGMIKYQLYEKRPNKSEKSLLT